MQTYPESKVIAALLEHAADALSGFSLVDVGASGGVAQHWSAFGETLRATGFDPLVTSMEKAAASEKRPHVRYECAYVGCDNASASQLARPSFIVDPYKRSSSVRAQQVKQLDYVSEQFNHGAPPVRTDRYITLDAYFEDADGLDFLKVDTDGHDFEVLRGAERLFANGEFLGVLVEAPFQGALDQYANTFANVNRFLTERGFVLYDFDCFRYSRAALPRPFLYDIPAQTVSGQVFLSDALYFRDLAHPEYETYWGYRLTRERLLKLVALFELFGLPDCAAELLQARPELTSEVERNRLLDLLVTSAGFSGTYTQHLARFDSFTEQFYPTTPGPAQPEESAVSVQSVVPRDSLLTRLGRHLLRRIRVAN